MMRIVYCTSSLSIGGIQSVTVTKANALAEIPGNSVWIVTLCDDSGNSSFPVSDKINRLRIPGRYYWPYPLSMIGVAMSLPYLRRKLKAMLYQIQPDVVVSTGGVEKWIIPLIRGDWSTVREYHNTKIHRKEKARSLKGRAVAGIADCFDYGIVSRKFDKHILLTQEEKHLYWSGNKDVAVIPNPLPFKSKEMAELKDRRIIAVGRLVYQKNFSSLIRAFASVARQYPEWRLDIYGEGEERNQLSGLIKDLGLDGVVSLRGTTKNIQEEMLSSSILALSSRFEGMPMTMIEAISCGLPVVSYACHCGPRDIITDGVNGFLVPEGDERMLSERICYLIEHEEERKRMGREAFESSSRYELSTVIREWMDLFEDLRSIKGKNR